MSHKILLVEDDLLIRTLSDFRSEGLIDIKDEGSILILDLKRLESLIN